jgi:S-layer protein
MATMTGTNLLESIIESTGVEVNALISATLSANLQQMIDNGTYSNLAASIAMSGFSTTINDATGITELIDGVEANAALIEAAADQAAVDAIDFPPIGGGVVEPVTFALTASSDSINEGDANTFTVEASRAVDEDTVVTFQLKIDAEGDTAQLADFNAGAFNAQTVTIAAGETTATFDLTSITNDGTEVSEKYTVEATVGGETFSTQVTLLDGSVGAGQTFQLTTGLDLIPGMLGSNGNTVTSGDDLIIGVMNSTGGSTDSTLSAVDSIDAGEGTNTLKVLTVGNGGSTIPTSMDNIQIVEVQSSDTGTIVADVRAITSATDLNVTKLGAALNATAGATTDVDVSVKAAGAAVNVEGGNDVNVALTGVVAADAVNVGVGGLSPAGAVTVSTTGAAYVAATGGQTTSPISVTGGTSITVTQSATSDDSAAATDVAALATSGATAQGTVTATAGATTTDITITQDATKAAVNAVLAVEAVATTQDITFTESEAGDTITLTTVGGNTIAFTTKVDLTAAETAAAFANLTTNDLQGFSAASNGEYTNTTTGTGVWSSGDAVTVSATESKVTFTTPGIAVPVGMISVAVTGTVTASLGALVAGTLGVAEVTGVMGITAGADSITGGAALTTVTADGYGAGSAITGATNTNLATINLANAGALANEDFTVSTQGTALALGLDNIGVSGTASNVNFSAAPITLNVANTDNNYVAIAAAATEALNVSGSGMIDTTGSNFTGVKTVTVADTASMVLAGTVSATVTSIDTTATTGSVSATIDGAVGSYAGGAGVDNLTLDTGVALTKTIDLGDGDDTLTFGTLAVVSSTVALSGGDGTDTLSVGMAHGNTLSAGAQTFYTDFERLTISDAAAVGALDLTNLGFNYVTTTGTAGGGTVLDKMTSDATVVLTAAAASAAVADAHTVNITDADTAPADVLNIVTQAATGVNLGMLVADDVETINVSVINTAVVPLVSTNTLILDGDTATEINIEGAGNLVLTLTDGVTAGSVAVQSINASTMTGNLTATTLAVSDGATTVTGGEGADMLAALGAGDILIGGAGNDTLNVIGVSASTTTLTGGEGIDTYDVSLFTAANPGAATTITDLEAGESIKFVSSATANFLTSAIDLIAEATFTEYVTEAASQANVAAGAANGIAWFEFNDNTFIVQENGGDGAFTDGTDIIVKLTGVVDLENSSFNDNNQGALEYII